LDPRPPCRTDVIEPSLAIVRDHPVIGTGAGTWPTVYPQYATMDFGVFMNEAHNDWLQWAGEDAIPDVAVFLALAVLAAWTLTILALSLRPPPASPSLRETPLRVQYE
jgi:O-antigen ligase